jgi:hypothetical protein
MVLARNLFSPYKQPVSKSQKRLRQFSFYSRNILGRLIPPAVFRSRRDRLLVRAEELWTPELERRLRHCIRLTEPFRPDADAVAIRDLESGGRTTYYFDLLNVLKYFDPHARFSCVFGDVTRVPPVPAFVKSRPIAGDNRNAVLLKLNRIRHFYRVKDRLPFDQKNNQAVWRGKCNRNEIRQGVVDRYVDHPLFNVGDSNKRAQGTPRYRGYMSIPEQLTYKFIISIEGNDVASNLKWILASQSLCLMPRPQYETWFCEGFLQPNVHYAEVKPDYSDLEERIEHFLAHPDEAKAIVAEANRHVEPFFNPVTEHLLSLRVAETYFRLSGQM